MSRLSFALLAVAMFAGGCYQDDTTLAGASRKPMAKVLLTDDPFPFDSVQSVQVYIVSIAVSTHSDTGTSADSMHWVTVASPHRQIDLLTLQQGLTDSLGIGQVTADQYKAVLVTLNVDSSAGIRFKNGVARSFPFNNRGDGAFDFFASMRAVNRAATGSIAGTVQHDASVGGSIGPVADATVSAWTGGPANWFVLSTGKTDAAGHYRIAYLLPGTYMISVDPPFGSNSVTSAVDSSVAVNQGFETTHNVTLHP